MDETKDLVPVIQIVDGRIQDNLTVVEQRVAEITEQYKLVVTDVKDARTPGQARSFPPRSTRRRFGRRRYFCSLRRD